MEKSNVVNTIDTTINGTVKAVTLGQYGDLLSAQELSEFLGISKQTIYKEIKMGKFGEPLKFGRTYKIPKIYIQQRYLGGYICKDG